MSATLAILDAVAARLTGDPLLRTYLSATPQAPRVFVGHAVAEITKDDGTAWPYVTIREPAEDEVPAYASSAAPLFADSLRVRVWVPAGMERLAVEGYGHVRRALVGPGAAPLAVDPVSGRAAVRVDVRLERTVPDPDGALQALVAVDVAATA